MRLLVIFLLLRVALASEVVLDDFTLRLKAEADQLEISLETLILLEEEESGRALFKKAFKKVKKGVKKTGKVVAGGVKNVGKDAIKEVNKVGKEINKIQGEVVHTIVNEAEKLYSTIAKQARQIVKEFEKIFVEIQNNCDCDGTICQCCSRVIPKQNICLELKIDKDEFAIRGGISWNDLSYKQKFTLKNPQPLCIPVPNVPMVSACMSPKDLTFQDNTFRGCFRLGLKINLLGEVLSTEITCVKGSKNGFKLKPPRSRQTQIKLPGFKKTI